MIAAVYAVIISGLLLAGCTSVIPVSKPGSRRTMCASVTRVSRPHRGAIGASMKHAYARRGGQSARAVPEWPDAAMNTSLEGDTMATYHVSVIIEIPDENDDEENDVEQAMRDLAAEHMWQIVSLTVLQP